jgi:branched-chain amino acid transport system substrate-binding protein
MQTHYLKVLSLFLFIISTFNSLYADPRIKIGVAVPLTGPAASYGIDIKNALELANLEIANGAYELIIEDDQCKDREAVTVAQKLINFDKVKYVLGFGCSGTVLSSAPEYERSKVIVIASGTGAPLIRFAGDYIFRTKPSLDIAAQTLADDMTKKYQRVGVISEETAYCQGLSDSLISIASNTKLKILNRNFLSETSDFRTILLELKSKGVEALFLNPQSEEGLIKIYKQLLALSWPVDIYGNFFPGSPNFLAMFGKQADGILYTDLPYNEQILTPEGLALYQKFEKKYGPAKSGEHFITLSFVAFQALHQAISAKPANLKEYLYKSKFAGIIKEFSFDSYGDIQSKNLTYILKRIKHGKADRPL